MATKRLCVGASRLHEECGRSCGDGPGDGAIESHRAGLTDHGQSELAGADSGDRARATAADHRPCVPQKLNPSESPTRFYDRI
jgi:hypothetical protein